MEEISVYLDEGSLDGSERLPSACAIVVGNSDDISQRIDDLIHELMLNVAFQHEANYSVFEKNGFHYVEDNFLAQQKFIDIIPELDFEWWCSSDISNHRGDPYSLLPSQFQWLIANILRKYHSRNIKLVFEQNDRLKHLIPKIVQAAVDQAQLPRDQVRFYVDSKQNRILSVADYCIAIAARAMRIWMKACCDTSGLAAAHEYRTFLSIEPHCSTLFAADLQKGLSNRASRLSDRSFYEVSGAHHAMCARSRQL